LIDNAVSGPVPEAAVLLSPAADVEDFGLAAAVRLPPTTVPYDPDKTRENYRGLIAMILISVMSTLIAASFALFWIHPDRSKDLQQFFSLIFGPVVALVGAATGYYFGSQSANKV
jgi:hypothetical protein